MTGASAAPAPAEVISLPDERSSIRRRLLQRSARAVAEEAFARAGDYDEDGAYPSADVAALHESGLLVAVLPVKSGGAGLTGLSLSEVLRSIGSGSLPLGRGCLRGMSTRSNSYFDMATPNGSNWLRRKHAQANCSASGTRTTRMGCG
jgi:Acyl-CoA dehydrogenase, N-terminal domain